MIDYSILNRNFHKNAGILRTSELKEIGLSSRQISKLVNEGTITRLKQGIYELSDYLSQDDAVIARLFPDAVLFLESALLHYQYTDRIPLKWQIAVDKHSKKSQYDISFIPIHPFYLDGKFLSIGIDKYFSDGIEIKIYDRERTICDVLRYENKIEKEVFNNAIQSYLRDETKNIRRLFEYAEVFNIRNKVQTYIGVWL